MSLKHALAATELYLQHNENPLLKRGIAINKNPPPIQATMTNGDRIRSMTDEELVGLLSRTIEPHCDYCQLATVEGACTDTLCEDAILKWLQQPADGGAEDG